MDIWFKFGLRISDSVSVLKICVISNTEVVLELRRNILYINSTNRKNRKILLAQNIC